MSTKNRIRITLLRILIASWMIPFAWLVLYPLAWLLVGDPTARDDTLLFCAALWNGVD